MGTTRAAEEVGASKDIVLSKSLPDIHLFIQQVVGEHLSGLV